MSEKKEYKKNMRGRRARKKVCAFCSEKSEAIDYKDINTNISDKFKIYTSQLPKGVKIMTLAPAYADVVFEKLFNLDTTKNVDKTIKE